jgi:hypothetical protein
MKTKLTFFFILISITAAYSQTLIPQVINTSGGTSQVTKYSIEWSIGELSLINEMDDTDSTYILTNGFIQSMDGLVQPPLQQTALSLNKIRLSFSDVRIFPNPTHDILEIHFFQSFVGKVSLQLYNELGHIVYTNEVSNHGSGFIEKINMKNFVNGVYLLYIKRLNPTSGLYDFETGSFKIIKM